MTLDPDQEQALVAAAACDPDAFGQLYDSYFPRVYAYVYYRLGHAADAEDVVADIFCRVAAALRRRGFAWRHEGAFAAWLFRIAQHTTVDHTRRARPPAAGLEALETWPAPGLSLEEEVLQQEEIACLRRLIGTLAPRRQETILLRFFGGLANREIAALLGLDQRTVAAHICRGLADLQRKYQAEEDLAGEAHR